MIVGSGIDVVEIARIARALERRGDRFAQRVFTERESADCRATARAAAHFAVRFAAKEAGMKAVGTGWARGVRWRDFESHRRGARGELGLRLYGQALELARQRGAAHCHLAVSLGRTHALALVLLEAGSA